MLKISYDLHIHSCLSPCGDDDMTPNNIVGMAALKELNVISVTDHNSCKNCPAIMKVAKEYGIVVIPGMELTTSEEVHVLCYFYTLEDALAFDEMIYSRMLPIKNREDVFGKQQICNEHDEVIGNVENLLINSTDISLDELYDMVTEYKGVMVPAHLDKSSTSIISNLGFVAPDSRFTCAEFKDMDNVEDITLFNPYLRTCKIISSSDAHYLEHINEAINHIEVEELTIKSVLDALSHNRKY